MSVDRPWEIGKKCAWKQFSIREKSRKKAKKSFHGHFWFSRGKKKTLDPSTHQPNKTKISEVESKTILKYPNCANYRDVQLSWRFYTLNNFGGGVPKKWNLNLTKTTNYRDGKMIFGRVKGANYSDAFIRHTNMVDFFNIYRAFRTKHPPSQALSDTTK